MKSVHQFVPTFEQGAIGSHMVELQKLLRDVGYESNIYAEHIRHDAPSSDAISFSDHAKLGGESVSIYHMAIGSNVADYVRKLRQPLIVNHHNLTPLEYLEPWEPGVSYGVQWGFRQLRELAPRTDLGIADSKFNEEQMINAGYRQTTVVPILFDTKTFISEHDDQLSARLALHQEKGEVVWLFVGRLSPNKCQHDIIKSFAFYRQTINPMTHLYIVGGASLPSYESALRKFVNDEDLDESVTITGSVSNRELVSYYQNADVFVCLSEHEGFCVPLLEAFVNELPVIAFRSSAVTDTLSDAGILLNEKSQAIVATAVETLNSSPQLRRQLVDAGKRRLVELDIENTKSQMLAAIEKVSS
jgi:glycosyltransferase involved in cell wall biosynthesis